MYQLIKSGALKEFYEIDPKDSWLIAACEKNLPIWTPGVGRLYVRQYFCGSDKGKELL